MTQQIKQSVKAVVEHLHNAKSDATSHGFPPGKEDLYLKIAMTDEQLRQQCVRSSQPVVFHIQQKIKELLDPNSFNTAVTRKRGVASSRGLWLPSPAIREVWKSNSPKWTFCRNRDISPSPELLREEGEERVSLRSSFLYDERVPESSSTPAFYRPMSRLQKGVRRTARSARSVNQGPYRSRQSLDCDEVRRLAEQGAGRYPDRAGYDSLCQDLRGWANLGKAVKTWSGGRLRWIRLLYSYPRENISPTGFSG